MNKIAESAKIAEDVILGDNITIEDDVFIDSHCIIRDNVYIKKGTKIGVGCILGEYLSDFYDDMCNKVHPLIIGKNSLLRSYTIIYGDTSIGDNFQSGHRVTIREKAVIGNNVTIGTLSDIQGYCEIGNYVNMHSNVHIGHMSKIDDYVWIFPYVVLTNDPTPPSDNLVGVHVHSFAIISTSSTILPGVDIASDSLIGAGAIVTKDVPKFAVVAGSPAKEISDVRKIKNKITGEPAYPWRYHFKRRMPWQDNGFKDWFANLSIEEIYKYNLEDFQ